jgi:hypothetical protein
LTVVNQPASKLALYSVPGTILADGKQYSNTIVQLVDESGNPEKTDIPITVQLALENLTSGTIPSQVTIQPGNTYAPIPITTTTTASNLTITAYANGFETGTITVRSMLLQMKVQAYVPVPRIQVRGETNITLFAEAQDSALSGANVTWIPLSGGTFIDMVNKTDATGLASATYVGSVLGGMLVEFIVSKPGYATVTGNTTIDVISPLNKVIVVNPPVNPLFVKEFGIIPLYLIIIPVAAAGGVGGFFFIRKRRMARADTSTDDDDEDDEEA